MWWLIPVLLIVLVGIWIGLIAFNRRRYAREIPSRERLLVPTRDGYAVALYHRPTARQRYAEPVILCHGLGANRFNLDFPGHSCAEFLREAGFDVWVAELRGASDATRPRGGASWRYTFDDIVANDIPALIDAVRQATGRNEVLWAGHSMGGMVMYAYLGTGGAHVKAAYAVASPSTFAHYKHPDKLSGLLGHPILKHLEVWPQSWLIGALMPFVGGKHEPFFLNDLAAKGTLGFALQRELAYNLMTPLSLSLVNQFAQWIFTKRFTSVDGSVDYLASLARVQTPVGFLAGADDQLAAPESVEAAYRTLGCPDKSYECLSRAAGNDHDYGHGDLIFAESAPREVFPRIAEFLSRHATSRS